MIYVRVIIDIIESVEVQTEIFPYTLVDFGIDFPNTSIPPNPDLTSFGVYPVDVPAMPTDNIKNYTQQLYYDEVNLQWKVNWIGVDKTPEELKAQVINQLNEDKYIDMRVINEQMIMTTVQAATAMDEIEAYKNLYPLWEDLAEGYAIGLDLKVNYIDNLAVLRLFRCIQVHSKQIIYPPDITPALWSELIFSGGIEVWSQPIGGDGKYPYIDPLTTLPYKVIHNGFTWENTLAAGLNVWEPGVYGWVQV